MPVQSDNFFKSFLGISFAQSYAFFAVSLLLILMVVTIRIFTKKVWPAKAHLAWNFSLYFAIIGALVLGLVFAGLNRFKGLTVLEAADGTKAYAYDWIYEVNGLTRIYATVFTSSISLVVGPLIFFGIGSKIATYTHSKSLAHSIKYMLIAVALAVLLGIALFQVFRILPNISLQFNQGKIESPAYTSILLTIVSWLPRNVLGSTGFSFFSISVLVFALILGFAVYLGKKHHPNDKHFGLASDFLVAGFKVFNVIADLIFEFLPIGVFGLFISAIIRNGGNLFISLAWFVIVFFLAMLLLFLVQLGFIWYKTKLNPVAYLKKAAKPLLSAFLTSSSNLTTPLSQKSLENEFRTDQVTASTMPILGTTMGMVACGALYPTMAAGFVLFVDNPFGEMDLSSTIIFLVFLFFGTFFSSFGLSGVPGVASVVTRNVFAITNLPFGATIGALLAIDPVIDMFRTFLNVNGIIMAAVAGDYQSKNPKKSRLIKHIKKWKPEPIKSA
ncbi:Na+/H+-dicarboxylate symporter [Mycoplasmoides fastidiosum]|uniref:L-cystine uptake protein TcyP n=1 Tax=Mycoplasmoides fastidiosum TaxID=92758 RepID=A0ABU0LZJ5_9BACT|nr:cation:dicarboxylase symporter family transporter [Mycoplasmoides fastidiosum]MDQ0514132.1 Na+/H+-dicarboxylate symporter [Mycoplasmoides fastidiosum]UUD37460.1 dicarboxylate/amino acid:cation symporter [Mycoplasmoides fastidiosum]